MINISVPRTDIPLDMATRNITVMCLNAPGHVTSSDAAIGTADRADITLYRDITVLGIEMLYIPYSERAAVTQNASSSSVGV
jgi:hypothetical protein